MKRYGWMIELHSHHAQRYKELHRDVWEDVLNKISDCNITNYTIFLREPENILFGYFEYTGNQFDADMRRMSEDQRTQEWWSLTDPCQNPLDTVNEGEKWAPMDEVFHHD
ncbi:MAG: L-rhamnose mutarotase [Pseudomonadota bacterium]